MTLARWLLGGGAVLLLATAAFHSTGLGMVSGWLPGQRGQLLSILWMALTVDWAVVALLWAWAAWRSQRAWRTVVFVSSLIPLALLGVVGTAHPGPFMLLASVALAIAGATRLR